MDRRQAPPGDPAIESSVRVWKDSSSAGCASCGRPARPGEQVIFVRVGTILLGLCLGCAKGLRYSVGWAVDQAEAGA